MLLSRLAATVFWFGRYVERAEDVARAVSAHERLCLDLPPEHAPSWRPLLTLTGGEPEGWRGRAVSEQESVLRFLLTEDQYGSVLAILGRAREDLRATRPLVPRETWQTLNTAYLALSDLARTPTLERMVAVLPEVVAACQQVTAQTTGTMTHDDAYRFLRLGRYLERADMLLRVTTIASVFEAEPAPRPFEDVLWMGLLKGLGAYQMYRRSNHGRVHPERAFTFLLAEERFPRSLNHCMSQVARELRSLPHGTALLERCDACRARPLDADAGADSATAYGEERLSAIGELGEAIENLYFA
ncbi:MAG: alpha-E domain-containing protein [Polyangiaceae bacterium]